MTMVKYKTEREFQASLIKEIKEILTDCMVIKLDCNYIQGIPDLLILWNDKWATLECKLRSSASRRPNQQYFVDKMNDMSFSRFIFPENKDVVLNELCKSFQS